MNTPCQAGAVISNYQVGPDIGRQRLQSPNADGIARPKMHQGEGRFSFFEHEFVTATARIGPGTRPMKNHGAFLTLGGPEPEPKTEGVSSAEGASPLTHQGIVAAKLQ